MLQVAQERSKGSYQQLSSSWTQLMGAALEKLRNIRNVQFCEVQISIAETLE